MNSREQVKTLLTNLGVEHTRFNIEMVISDLGLVVEPEECIEPGVYEDGDGNPALLDERGLITLLDGSVYIRDSNDYERIGGLKPLSDSKSVEELTEAIRLTVEYVGNDMLPAIDGWSWFDALKKYAPDLAKIFVDKPTILHHVELATITEKEASELLDNLQKATGNVGDEWDGDAVDNPVGPTTFSEKEAGELWNKLHESIDMGGLEWYGDLMDSTDRHKIFCVLRAFISKMGRS